MASLDDMMRSALPGGNIGKPLMIALLGLLASGALFRSSPSAPNEHAPKPPAAPANEGAGGLLGGLGGLLERFQQSGHGNVINSWVGSGQNSTGPARAARHHSRTQYHQDARSELRIVGGGAHQAAVPDFPELSTSSRPMAACPRSRS